jgi:hypothetical protein
VKTYDLLERKINALRGFLAPVVKVGLEKGGAGRQVQPEVFRNGLAHIRQTPAGPEVDAARQTPAEKENRNIFAGVIGARGRRIAPVIRGDDQTIVVPKRVAEFGQPAIELLQAPGVAA